MLPDRLQTQRFELKYLISESKASAIRDFVSSYLRLDPHGASHPDFSYPVHSLYLDSPPLTTCWETINGSRNRYKLRLRFYAANSESPVFFEIKQRADNAVLKQRSLVRRDAVAWLLSGQLPDAAHLLSSEPRHLAALERFSHLVNRINAAPKARVSYLREAWVGEDRDSFRLTMDRHVQLDAESTAQLREELNDPVDVFGNQVVLELKFTDRYPSWAGDMVRVFGLRQGSAAKYVDGVVAIGEEKITGRWPELRDPETSALFEARREALRVFQTA